MRYTRNFVTKDHADCDLKTECLRRMIINCFQRRYKTLTATNLKMTASLKKLRHDDR
jgi:hypothetical protein